MTTSGVSAQDRCKVCGTTGRYVMANGDVYCTAHVPDVLDTPPTGCKVFSATRSYDRDHLGERMTEWLRVNDNVEVTQTFVVQSSDTKFHCVSTIIFYRER